MSQSAMIRDRGRSRGAQAAMRASPIVPLAAVGALLAGCGSTGAQAGEELRSDVQRQQVDLTDAAAAADVVAATDVLGHHLLAQSPAAENSIGSPVGLLIALSMVGEGARGESAAELDALLGAGGAQRSDVVNALTARLLTWDGDPALAAADELPEEPLLHVANNAVVHEGFEVEADFLDALAEHYDAGLGVADLTSDAGKEVLDAWVAEHSGGLIEESAIEPNDDLRLVLQNAIVLAAQWETPFAEHATRPAPFTLTDGSEVEVESMHGLISSRYAEVDGWQAGRLAYTDEHLYADIVLPPAGATPDDLTPDLGRQLTDALDTAEPVHVDWALPKVDLAVKTDLLDLLGEHTPTLVDPGRADLSGIADEQLYVQQAVQQTVFAMDEQGTVAAAVTEAGIAGVSAPPPAEVAMTVDRPYLVRLGVELPETDAGSLTLFLARVADPTQSDD